MANLFEDLTDRSNGEEVDASWWNSIIVALRQTFPGESSITGDIVGTTDTQIITNKTVDADNNTITNLAHGAEVDNPSTGVHGVTGSVVGTTDTQDLSNKTFTDSLTLQELGSTPSTPGSGDKKLYSKNDGKLYSLDDAGNEVEVGAGGGGGGSKNYIDSESAELETTVGNWLSDDGSGSVDSDFVVTTTTSADIAGTRSLSVEKAAADTEDSFAKCLTTAIDPTDRGKTLYGSFSYDATHANYVSGDLVVQVYDVTNSAILYSGLAADLGILKTKGRFNFTAQTEATTASIELRLICSSTNASVYNVIFDEFKLGPAAQVSTIYRKSAILDATGSGDFTGGSIQVDRVGNIVTITNVSALTCSSSSSISSATGFLPEWARPIAPVTNTTRPSASFCIEVISKDTGVFQIISYNPNTGVAVARTSITAHTLSYNVPALPSPTVTDNELSLQTISVSGAGNGGTSLTANVTNIDFIEVADSHGAWTGSTFVAPKSGKFRAQGQVKFTTGASRSIRVYIDGVLSKQIVNSSLALVPFSWVGVLEKGAVLAFRSEVSATLSNEAVTHHLEIESVQDYTLLGVSTEGITSGSNSNGRWVKYPDGTLICTHELAYNAITSGVGSVFRSSSSSTWTFPATYSVRPQVNAQDASSNNIWMTASTTATDADIKGFYHVSLAGARTSVLSAVGRWY